MDRSESIALQHLDWRFPGAHIVFEPDGQRTPDFLIDGRIAVEVRRLDEHDGSEPAPRSLVETSVPLIRHLRSLVNMTEWAGSQTHGIIYHYGRPLASKREVDAGVRAFLASLQESDDPVGQTAEVAPRLHLTCSDPVARTGSAYSLLGGWDDNQGGDIRRLLVRNTAVCIESKTARMIARRQAYPEWWLMLVDYVSHGAVDYSHAEAQAGLRALPHTWDSVILVDPLDVTSYYEF